VRCFTCSLAIGLIASASQTITTPSSAALTNLLQPAYNVTCTTAHCECPPGKLYIRPSTEAGEVRDDLKRGSIQILNAPLGGRRKSVCYDDDDDDCGVRLN
jgi:hypothetical protein